MFKRILFSFIIVLSVSLQFVFCQDDIQKWENKIYKQGIKTVLMHPKGNELLMPVIELNSEEKLILQFDELGTEINDYLYKIVHCNANWEESDLMPLEYIEGFNDLYVNDYALSQNTLMNYVNYQIELPNRDLKILKSGNYITKVFERDNPDKLVLVRKFYVYTNQVKLQTSVDLMNVAVQNGLNQRININLNCNPEIENPAATVFIKALQNGGFCKNFKDIKPTYVSGQTLRYTAVDEMAFAGGSGFRHFDIKNFKFISDRIYTVKKMPDLNYVYLRTDEDNGGKVYKFKHDINGHRTIKVDNSTTTSNIMSDYGYVFFQLDCPLPLQNGDFYVYGALTDWGFPDEAKLVYNADNSMFEGKLLVKQGYYNYQYIFQSKDKMMSGDDNKYLVEGNHFQTENEYHIFVYHKAYNADYDQLIAYGIVNSTRNSQY